jgi:hypothetical protein
VEEDEVRGLVYRRVSHGGEEAAKKPLSYLRREACCTVFENKKLLFVGWQFLAWGPDASRKTRRKLPAGCVNNAVDIRMKFGRN